MKILKRIISVTLFAIILFGCICRTANIVQRKSSDFKYTPFFQQEEDFDVLFMGTSHVLNAIFPMELWNEYGIVSYNFGGHSNRLPTTYWVMENAMDYTTPSLVVVDVLNVESNVKIFSNSDKIHLSLDCFPITKTKIKGVYDLCDDPNAEYYDHKWEFIWDFGKYHSRWTEISQDDITNELVTLEKGAESRIAVAKPNEYKLLDRYDVLESSTVGMEYLKKMIETCQERGIEVLLVNLPYPAGKEAQRAANSVYEIADHYGVNYINFVAMDSVVDYSTDCYDPDSHLNPSGARKVTEYLGQYIREHYDIPDRRTDPNYQSWFDDYVSYVNFKVQNLNDQNTIDTELMLLADDDFSTCIYVKENSDVLKNQNISQLIQNLCRNTGLPLMDKATRTGESYFLVVDNGNGSIKECLGDEQQNWSTSFGEVSYTVNEGIPNLNIKNLDTNQLYGDWFEENSKVSEPDVQIFVINNSSHEIVSSSKWDYSITETVARRK